MPIMFLACIFISFVVQCVVGMCDVASLLWGRAEPATVETLVMSLIAWSCGDVSTTVTGLLAPGTSVDYQLHLLIVACY